jgi:hypothetical protein
MRGMLCTYCLSFGFSWYRQLALKGRRLCHVCRVGLSAKIVRILRTHHDGSLELRGSGLGEAFCSGLTRNSVLRIPAASHQNRSPRRLWATHPFGLIVSRAVRRDRNSRGFFHATQHASHQPRPGSSLAPVNGTDLREVCDPCLTIVRIRSKRSATGTGGQRVLRHERRGEAQLEPRAMNH